jgi:hypothetical protein
MGFTEVRKNNKLLGLGVQFSDLFLSFMSTFFKWLHVSIETI